MSKKKRKFEMNLPASYRYIENLRYKDLKRECVVRGMEFSKVVAADISALTSFFTNNFYVKTKHELLDLFDDWQEAEVIKAIEAKGEDPSSYIHPSLRLGYVAEKDDEGNVTKRKRAKVIVAKVKAKRDRTNDGLFSGTKKAYTFQLQKEGKTKAETLEAVLKQFPEASEKSVGIWYNKARKLHGKKK